MSEQLDLFAEAAQHVTETYTVVQRVPCQEGWHGPYLMREFIWWAYRCMCGHDVGLPAEQPRALYSHRESAEQMAAHHRHDYEPWLSPTPKARTPRAGVAIPGRGDHDDAAQQLKVQATG